MTKALVAEKTKIRDSKLFINGEYVDALSGETFDSLNPATNKKLATVANGGQADAKLAIDVAQKTFVSGIWSNMPVEERSKILCKMADLIMEKVDQLAYVETLDVESQLKKAVVLIFLELQLTSASLRRWRNIWFTNIMI